MQFVQRGPEVVLLGERGDVQQHRRPQRGTQVTGAEGQVPQAGVTCETQLVLQGLDPLPHSQPAMTHSQPAMTDIQPGDDRHPTSDDTQPTR